MFVFIWRPIVKRKRPRIIFNVYYNHVVWLAWCAVWFTMECCKKPFNNLCFPTIITEIIFIYFYHDDDDDDDMIIKIAYYFTNQRILSPKICGGIQTKQLHVQTKMHGLTWKFSQVLTTISFEKNKTKTTRLVFFILVYTRLLSFTLTNLSLFDFY